MGMYSLTLRNAPDFISQLEALIGVNDDQALLNTDLLIETLRARSGPLPSLKGGSVDPWYLRERQTYGRMLPLIEGAAAQIRHRDYAQAKKALSDAIAIANQTQF